MPNLFASGSDDGTIKLWNVSQPDAVLSLPSKTTIHSVKFNPHSRYMLAYGAADHGVHYVDLRSPKQPLKLVGHKKAVSYVDFMSPNEIVSAYVALMT